MLVEKALQPQGKVQPRFQLSPAVAFTGKRHPLGLKALLLQGLTQAFAVRQRHSLGVVTALHRLPRAGRTHRALAVAEVTATQLKRIQADLSQRFELSEARHPLLKKVQSSPARHGRCCEKVSGDCAAEGAEAGAGCGQRGEHPTMPKRYKICFHC